MPFPPVPPPFARALAARGYDEPTAVQRAVLDAGAGNRDLLVSARTGSGKTVAFGLAVGADLLGPDGDRFAAASRPLVLVVAPTRELALQVAAELAWLTAEAAGRVLTAVGGMDPRREARLLLAGAHIVVGTPGRLRDHLERGNLDLSALRAVVLDEADEMLDLGFREELEAILDRTPAERRTLLFSATLPPTIVALARRYQRDAVRIDSGGGGNATPHADIAYEALPVAPGEIVPATVNVLRFHDAPVALVFCATRDNVRAMWTALSNRGFDAVALSGELSQNDRNGALHALRAGRARVCVATDVAARGLDLPALSLVVHAELPANAPLLLHRSGRTGRAGRKGTSVLLVPPARRRRAETLLREAGIRAEWREVPAPDAIRRRDHERLLADPILRDEPVEDERALAATLLRDHDAEAVAVALLRLHRAGLPEEAPVTAVAAGPAPDGHSPRRHVGRAADRGAAWLSASVGRNGKADPKWLLPLLCRIGGVTRREIGLIRVGPDETRFEIAPNAVERFLDRARQSDGDGLRIARSEPFAAGPEPSRRHTAHPPPPPRGERSSRRR